MRKLIKSAIKGDAKAFIELMDLYNYDLYKTGKAILKTDEDVADAMQDTILACWQNIKYLKKPRYFKTWLTKIMINCCFKILEKRKKYVLNDEIQNDIILNSGYSQSEFNSIEINDILNNMDEKYRYILILYYMQGFSTPEIGKILNLKESTVRSRLKRGRDKFASSCSMDEKQLKAL